MLGGYCSKAVPLSGVGPVAPRGETKPTSKCVAVSRPPFLPQITTTSRAHLEKFLPNGSNYYNVTSSFFERDGAGKRITANRSVHARHKRQATCIF